MRLLKFLCFMDFGESEMTGRSGRPSRTLVVQTLLLLHFLCGHSLKPSPEFIARRPLLKAASIGLFVATEKPRPSKATLPPAIPAAAAAWTSEPASAALAVAEAYAVLPDNSKLLSPTTKALELPSLVAELSQSGTRAVFLGEHHDSSADHLLQAALISELRPKRDAMAVGLEAVQRRFQPVLNDYVAGRINEEQLERDVEWKRRWFWPFNRYVSDCINDVSSLM